MSEEELAAARPRPRARGGWRRTAGPGPSDDRRDPSRVAPAPSPDAAELPASGMPWAADPRPPGHDPAAQLEHRLHTLERRLLVAVETIERTSSVLDQRLTALEQGLREQLDAHTEVLTATVDQLERAAPTPAGAPSRGGTGHLAVVHDDLTIVHDDLEAGTPPAGTDPEVAALLDEVASRLDAFARRVAAIEDPRAALDQLAGRIDALSAELAEVARRDDLAGVARREDLGPVHDELAEVARRDDLAPIHDELAEVARRDDLAEVATVQGIETLLAHLEELAGERGVGGLRVRLDQLARGGGGPRRLRRGAAATRLEDALGQLEALLAAGPDAGASDAGAGVGAAPGAGPAAAAALPESAFWSEEHRAAARAELRSWVLEVERVGPKRADALADAFGDLDELAAASVDDVVTLTGLPADVAAAVLAYVTS